MFSWWNKKNDEATYGEAVRYLMFVYVIMMATMAGIMAIATYFEEIVQFCKKCWRKICFWKESDED